MSCRNFNTRDGFPPELNPKWAGQLTWTRAWDVCGNRPWRYGRHVKQLIGILAKPSPHFSTWDMMATPKEKNVPDLPGSATPQRATQSGTEKARASLDRGFPASGTGTSEGRRTRTSCGGSTPARDGGAEQELEHLRDKEPKRKAIAQHVEEFLERERLKRERTENGSSIQYY